ncbi:putative integrase/recombinase y4rA [Paraburkholderia piptadeniae]|uniref:Tyrosine-type recombinase/integrase n=3 Tax=Burkholderiaceae TaxID=119060 RepID=A0A7X1TLK7_9BURK|nr:tyrosine-type recombinase/integrase [Paraburkholderia franconis]SIT50860.1 putative integrase/recombinase y4rA [Paraburkholderia piptadeniae]
MKYVIHDRAVLSRPPEGPLAAPLVLFARALSDQGYCAYSLHRQVRIAADFSRWLAHKGIGIHHICTDHATRYLRHRARIVRLCRGDRAALGHLMEFLRSRQLIPAEKVPASQLSPIERSIEDYVAYLREARALTEATIRNYVPFVRSFLEDCFGNQPVSLSRLRAIDIVRFVRRQAPRLHPKRAKLMTAGLRSFLRYASYRGDVALDLAAAVPVVANWSMPAIPRAIAPVQTRRLLASIDRRSAVGRRDYAILLLLARLGLRSGEVAFLELSDIDWTKGCLTVRNNSGLRNELPLPPDVGRAIAAYLSRDRPPGPCRRVFLRSRAPFTGFRSACAVGSVVRHSLQRAGIDAPTMGAHQFRHGLATEMLYHGASLGEIGELLGHRHPQTTRIYTKVDIKALRTLAVPWPGGVR